MLCFQPAISEVGAWISLVLPTTRDASASIIPLSFIVSRVKISMTRVITEGSYIELRDVFSFKVPLLLFSTLIFLFSILYVRRLCGSNTDRR